MTTDLARSFADQIAELDDLPIDDGAPLGTFTWMHGNKAGKTPGAFYAKAVEFADPPAAPWESDNDRFEQEEGFKAETLALCFICHRQQWYTGDGSKEKPKKYLANYEDGAGCLVEYLVLVEGVEFPMILSLSKINKSRPIQDALSFYRRGLLHQASMKIRKTLKQYTFWLPFATKRTADGKVEYREVERKNEKGVFEKTGSFVTPPVLILPPDPMNALYVGNDTLRYAAELEREYEWWTKARRATETVEIVEGEVVESFPALPPGKNTPQPIEAEEDMPF